MQPTGYFPTRLENPGERGIIDIFGVPHFYFKDVVVVYVCD